MDRIRVDRLLLELFVIFDFPFIFDSSVRRESIEINQEKGNNLLPPDSDINMMTIRKTQRFRPRRRRPKCAARHRETGRAVFQRFPPFSKVPAKVEKKRKEGKSQRCGAHHLQPSLFLCPLRPMKRETRNGQRTAEEAAW